MAEAQETNQTTQPPAAVETADLSVSGDADFYKAEARKAFEARQKAKAEADEWRRKYEDKERADQERAAQEEQEKARKAGDFEKVHKQTVDAYEAKLAAATGRANQAEEKMRQQAIGRAFADASSLFGANGKTKYQAWEAERVFKDNVRVDENGVVTVVDANGDVIIDVRTGKPAPFAVGMNQLIESHPDNVHIVRGSGKTGSGSSGGSLKGSPDGRITDFSQLTPEQRRDPKVLEQIRRQQPRGGMVFGRAYDQ